MFLCSSDRQQGNFAPIALQEPKTESSLQKGKASKVNSNCDDVLQFTSPILSNVHLGPYYTVISDKIWIIISNVLNLLNYHGVLARIPAIVSLTDNIQ